MNVKYCVYPVEDGRCGNSFSSIGIKSTRKYCDEHLSYVTTYKADNTIVYSSNKYAQISNNEEMYDWVRKEMSKTTVPNKELIMRINELRRRIDSIEETVKLSIDNIIQEKIDNAVELSLKGDVISDKLQKQILTLNSKINSLTEIVENQKEELKNCYVKMNDMDYLNKNNRIYKNIMNKNKNKNEE